MRGDAKRSKRSLDVKASEHPDGQGEVTRLERETDWSACWTRRTERRRRSINQPFEPADSQTWLDFLGPSLAGWHWHDQDLPGIGPRGPVQEQHRWHWQR